VQDFDAVLRNAKRALKAMRDKTPAHLHRSQALQMAQNHIYIILKNCDKFKPNHTPDMTGRSVSINVAVRQMFWMHRIRKELKEANADFNGNFPFTSQSWLAEKLKLLENGAGPPGALCFIDAWRTVLTS
jgi:hypothetical protein